MIDLIHELFHFIFESLILELPLFIENFSPFLLLHETFDFYLKFIGLGNLYGF